MKSIFIIIIIIILTILVIVFLNKSTLKNLTQSMKESNCSKEDIINDIKSCQTGISLKGRCNNIINKFFKDENIDYSDKYLDNAYYTYPAFIVSQYNVKTNQSELVLPYKMYQKILNSKLKNKNSSICVFVGQSGLELGKTKTPFGDIKLSNLFQLYHSSLFFVEMTDDKIPDPQKNPQDVLFTIELWGEGGRETILSNFFPLYKKENDKYIADKDVQSLNKIIIQFPEAFGCKNDGSYWNNMWQNIEYLGNISKLSIESLYFFSNFFISRYWGYSVSTLTSIPCDNINQLPDSTIPCITCDTFVQYMCTVLEIVDSNFRKYNNYKNVSWNDLEIIGKYSEVDLNNPNELNDLQIYNSEIDAFLKENTKQKFTVSPGQNMLSKIIINKIGAEFFQLMIRYITKNVNIKTEPCMYMSLFHNGTYKIYKILLEYPYVQSIYDVCPGKMFKKSNYIFF